MPDTIVAPSQLPCKTPILPALDSPPNRLCDMVDAFRQYADRLDLKALAHIDDKAEFLRYRRMARVARQTSAHFAAQMRRGVRK